ncbi:hypothetical protein JHK87_053169 [Glycine soja]|nr:hypothetical protein JHK87_053169 [Glycine soja]
MKCDNLFQQNRTTTFSDGGATKPPISLTDAHDISPKNSFGRATTATLFNAGCAYNTASTSMPLKFSSPSSPLISPSTSPTTSLETHSTHFTTRMTPPLPASPSRV